MSIINIPSKSAGDTFFSEEVNQIVQAIKALQQSTGWGSYKDTIHTEDSNSQEIVGNGNWFTLENNGQSKIETYLPTINGEAQSLYSGSVITPPSVGSTFTGYLRFFAKVDSNESEFSLGIDIGGAVGIIFVNTIRFVRANNVYQEYTIPFNGYMLDSFKTNGGRVVIRPEDGKTINIYGATFYIGINYQQP